MEGDSNPVNGMDSGQCCSCLLGVDMGKTDQAIAAMGYSGQLKFVPLLLELAQAEDSREAATDSLALLLGIAEADSLLSATKATTDFQLAQGHARQLSGGHINSVQLDDVWLRGNQQQRQLVACYRSLAAAGTPLLNVNALSCRL